MRAFPVLSFLAAGVCLSLADDLSSSSFAYGVNDPVTGDIKDQQEVRIGDSVSGHYRTLDADNFLRTVNYNADDFNGFNAEVLRQPIVVEPIAPEPVAAPAPVFDSPDPIFYGPAGGPAPVFNSPDPIFHGPAPVFNSPDPIFYGPVGGPTPIFNSPESVYHEPAPVYHSAEPIAAYQPAAPVPIFHSAGPIAYQPQEHIVYRSYSPLVYRSPKPTVIQQLPPPTFVKTTVEQTPIVPAVYTAHARPSLSALIKSKIHKHPIVSSLKKVGSFLIKKH